MNSILTGQNLTLTIPLVDSSGVPLTATAVAYRVIDQDEVELVVQTPVPGYVAPAANAVVTILAANNNVGTAQRALRVVELFVTTASGMVVVTAEYVIEATSIIVVGVNSLQTYPAAVMCGYEQPNLTAWQSASRVERANALIAAYRNLGKLVLRYVNTEITADQTRLVTPYTQDYNITTLTKDQLLTLEKVYLDALCRAQVIEADYLLGGDEADGLRRSGIMSMTIGESSQFFRTTRPFEGAICRRAMKEIGQYIVRSIAIGRA